MRTLLPVLLALTTLASIPLVTGCYCADDYEPYATETGAVALVADAPVTVPIRISAPDVADSDPTVLDVAITDCAAAEITGEVRLLRDDGTAITPSSTSHLECPDRAVRFRLPTSELTCVDGTCSTDLEIEITPDATMGGRAIEARLVRGRTGSCEFPRTDASVVILPSI